MSGASGRHLYMHIVHTHFEEKHRELRQVARGS